MKLSIYNSWVTSENTAQSVEACLNNTNAIVIVTEHSDVTDKLSKVDLRSIGAEVIVDGRNCLEGEEIKDMGILYRSIGRRG